MKKIGILGGTFDPVHHGHLIIAEEVRINFNLDQVLFIPNGIPWQKNDRKVTPSFHRLNMVELAVVSNGFFKASDIEITRQGYTYAIDTLNELKAGLGPDVILYFIIGADVVFDLMTWRNFDKVFTLCEFIAVMRPGYDEKQLKSKIEDLNGNYGALIHLTTAPLVEIGSTELRKRIGSGKSIKYMVPENVERYILENQLYI